jgi:adenosylcobinamide-phosphate synthase
MGTALIAPAAPDAFALAAALALDLALGDPVSRAHPVRLMGATLSLVERMLRRAGAYGYGGGVLLLLVLAGVWIPATTGAVIAAAAAGHAVGWAIHVFIVYSLIALGDLLRHVWRVERALGAGDLAGARRAVAHLVGRDTDRLDAAACRRAAIECLSESLTDGVTSPIFWYVLGGIPGLVLFKIASTMDSMVGYKTDRYRKFGWCGARLDDVMNFVPARLTWILVAATAAVLPGCSAWKAWRVGLTQHAVLLGPNAGWSEAATAGAIQRRIVGPIWRNGQLVTEVWIGDAGDPPAARREDLVRAMRVVTAAALAGAAVAAVVL